MTTKQELRNKRDLELAAVAAVKEEFGNQIAINFGCDWRGEECHVTFRDGDSPYYLCAVAFGADDMPVTPLTRQQLRALFSDVGFA